MALSETAHLAVQLDLQGNLTSGLAKAEAGLTRFSGVAGKVGGALSHAKTAIGGLISGPLGLIGLTGGLLTAGGAIKSTLDHMNDLAFGTEKLTALTGDSAQTISTLIAASEKYGVTLDKLTVTAGFYEKAVGKLEVTGKLTDFQKEFGVALTDNTGKALGFSEALLSVADVFATSTDEAKNATLAAALFGRSYTGLIPVLALGRQGILDLEKEAAAMGLQLSEANVADFAKYREAIRGSQEAISGLEVAIGEDLLPTISDLANGLKSFVSDHKTDIVAFFHNAVAAGKQAAGVIAGLVGTIQGFWNSIPSGFRDLLVKGFIADKTIKFLFGFDPAGAAIGALQNAVATGLAKGAVTAGIGKLFVQPVFVTNPGFGAGGLPGLAAGAGEGAAAAGGISALGIFGGLAAAGVIVAVAGTALAHYAYDHAFPGALNPDAHYAGSGLRGAGPGGGATIPHSDTIRGATDDWVQAAHALTASMNAGDKSYREAHADLMKVLYPRDYALTAGRQVLIDEIKAASAARYGGTGLGPAAVENTLQNRIAFAAERIATNGDTQENRLAELRDLEDQLVQKGDTKAKAAIDRLTAKVAAEKPPVVNVTIPIRVIQDGYLVSTTTRIVNGTPTTVVSRN